MASSQSSPLRSEYRVHILLCICAALLLVIGLIRLWPTPTHQEKQLVYHDEADTLVEVDEIQPTRQEQAPPPPPVPLPPVEVPDDWELEEIELDLAAELSEEWADDPGPPEVGDDEPRQASAPDVAARQLRLVEPTYSQEARRQNIRAKVVVEVQIDADGKVVEATITERMLLDEDNQPVETVSHLGYGLEESALDAARRTTFIPAQAGGEPVASRTTITIRFGV